jgi:hypothetical protein
MSTKLEIRSGKLEVGNREPLTSNYQLLKSEKREKRRLKRKQAPKGATLAGQKRKMEVSKFYKGKINR